MSESNSITVSWQLGNTTEGKSSIVKNMDNDKLDIIINMLKELQLAESNQTDIGSKILEKLNASESNVKKEIGDFIAKHLHIKGISQNAESTFVQELIEGIWSIILKLI